MNNDLSTGEKRCELAKVLSNFLFSSDGMHIINKIITTSLRDLAYS